MSKMIKVSLVFVVFVFVAVASYAFWQKKPMVVSEPRHPEKSNKNSVKVDVPKTNDQSLLGNKQDRPSSTVDLDSFFVPEVGVSVLFPNKYLLSKSKEQNRRGSFVSYDFDQLGDYSTPHLDELQFFSENSIKSFLKGCEGVVCFFGDYPDLERYYGQKTALAQSGDYQDFKLQNFNNRKWLVSNHRCLGDSCIIREYTIFLDDTKFDVSIVMASLTEDNRADELFSRFKIE